MKYNKSRFGRHKITKCQKCAKKFSQDSVRVVYKEVMECTRCGEIVIDVNSDLLVYV